MGSRRAFLTASHFAAHPVKFTVPAHTGMIATAFWLCCACLALGPGAALGRPGRALAGTPPSGLALAAAGDRGADGAGAAGDHQPPAWHPKHRPHDARQARRQSFADIDALTALCERATTAECLDHMRTRKRDYLTETDATLRNNPNLVHMFWRGPLKPHPVLAVKSFAFTQHLDTSRLVFWADGVDDVGPLEAMTTALPHAVEVRPWNASREVARLDDLMEARGRPRTSLAQHLALDTPATYSDAVRFIVLTLYGGIYVDADTLLLRDLGPLFDVEFAYRWSSTNTTNTAVMGLHKHSEYGLDMHARRGGYWPQTIIGDRIRVLPAAWFDPLWLVADGIELAKGGRSGAFGLTKFADVFTVEGGVDLATAFDGAFACHWHNMWDKGWAAGSFMGWHERMADAFIASKAWW